MIKFCNKPAVTDLMKLFKEPTSQNDETQEIITRNIMTNLMQDKSYFFTENFFKINFIELNNLRNYDPVDVKIEFLFSKNFDFGKIQTDRIKYFNDADNEIHYCSKCDNKEAKNIKKNSVKLFERLLEKKLKDENNYGIYNKETSKCTCKSKGNPSIHTGVCDKEKHLRLVILFFYFYFSFFIFFRNFYKMMLNLIMILK
jgi:hypothetical protein